jgi:hypothetical protein
LSSSRKARFPDMWGKVVSFRHSGAPAEAGEPGLHTHDALYLR